MFVYSCYRLYPKVPQILHVIKHSVKKQYFFQSVCQVSNMAEAETTCIFCRIVKEKSTEIFYEDDEFISFKDIKPAASHHYLIIPKKHIKDPKSLTSSDVDLVKKLLSIGEEVLKERNASIEDSRFGYHWPPFNSVQHLHMHAVSPVSEMNFYNRLIFRPDSYWFKNATTVIQELEKESEK